MVEVKAPAPLDKLIVDKEGIVELGKATDYGTHNYYA